MKIDAEVRMPFSDVAPNGFEEMRDGGISFKHGGEPGFDNNADLKIGPERFEKSKSRRGEHAIAKGSQANKADARILGQVL
jgi:hypothetical protein